MMKKIFSAAAVFAFALLAAVSAAAQITVIYTNDVHCFAEATEDTFGYADLAAHKARVEATQSPALLADAGDFLSGAAMGTLSRGEYIIDIMNYLGYNAAAVGNHDFDYGIERLVSLSRRAAFPFVCANFTDLRTHETVFAPYTSLMCADVRVAFVGICAPSAVFQTDTAAFMSDGSDFLFGFTQDFFGQVQRAADMARAEGAQYVIALSHLGTDAKYSPYTSREVIAATRGFDVFIDAHSHDAIGCEIVNNKDGAAVTLTSAGSEMRYIGNVVFADDGSVNSYILSKADFTASEDAATAEGLAYTQAQAFIASIEEQLEQAARTKVAEIPLDLVAQDAASGQSLVQCGETNLGDFCADAFRTVLGADCALINGGALRADLKAREVTRGDILELFPDSCAASLIRASGQRILDALELSVSAYPKESSAFLQVAGLAFELHSYIASPVVKSESGEYLFADGERRVKNVTINGEPLEADKLYTIAGTNDVLTSYEEGYAMFEGCEIVNQELCHAATVMERYLGHSAFEAVALLYQDAQGDGRIKIVQERPFELTAEQITAAALVALMTALVALFIKTHRKKLNK